MDYTIGSLSELITGKAIPDKKKVVKKQITSLINSNKLDENDDAPLEIKADRSSRKRKNLDYSEDISQSKIPKVDIQSKKPHRINKNKVNAERRISNRENPKKIEEPPESRARTIFVGNLPITLDNKKIKKIFSKYGKVEAVRIRGAPVPNPKIPKKVAIIKKEFHPDRKSFYAFVRFENRDDAVKAVNANGVLYEDHHLRIRFCDDQQKSDGNKAIFVGNLSFYAEEEDLWKIFESCGPITSVRIVRDPKTGIGKGFGYVNFESTDSVTLALEMENVKIKDRELRINVCKTNVIKKSGKKEKKNKRTKVGEKDNTKKEKIVGNKNKSFEGYKFVAKTKKKINKGLLEKKKKSRQVMPK